MDHKDDIILESLQENLNLINFLLFKKINLINFLLFKKIYVLFVTQQTTLETLQQI